MRVERKPSAHYASSPQLWSTESSRLKGKDGHKSVSNLHWAYADTTDCDTGDAMRGKKVLTSFNSGNKVAANKKIGEPADVVAVRKIQATYDSFRRLADADDEEDDDDRVPIGDGGSSTGAWTDGSTEASSQPSHDAFEEVEEEEEEEEEVQNWQKGQLCLSEQDRMQVEMFFRGHKTHVFVCGSLANLYVSNAPRFTLPRNATMPTNSDAMMNSPTAAPKWELKYMGVPVLLLDYGETRSRNRRCIQLLLAERGTGFMLWRDTVDNLSSYKAIQPTFHTMHLSKDHRQIVGLSFDNASAAQAFLAHLEHLTSDPANICLSSPNSKGKRRQKSKKTEKVKVIIPRKADISQPCCFQHVTNVESGDRTRFYSLQTFVSQQQGDAITHVQHTPENTTV